MHRSGTSVAARAVQLLGVSLGDDRALMAPGPDNKAGYYENRSIKEFNDELLAHLNGSWDQPPVLDPGWEASPDLDPYRARAAAILDEAFGPEPSRAALLGWKDPRLALLLPFWQSVIPIDTTIVLVRNPAEVAASLRARNRIEAPQAALLWLRYLFAAAVNDQGHLLIGHRGFFDDLHGTLASMARHLALPQPAPEVEAAVQGHLDASLHHHVAPDAGGEPGNPIVALASAVWNEGRVDLGVLPEVVGHALARGWFRSPIDTELLTRARAQVVELRELVRRRSREAQAKKEVAEDPAPDTIAAEDLSATEQSGDEAASSCHG
jgi:hypothetical protein